MKILTNKEYKKLLDYNLELIQEAKEARDLKKILDKITSLTINGSGFAVSGGTWSTNLTLPDDVPRYVEDYCGGRVIKQEATKVIEITKTGEIKTGLTKQPADKGFDYKLIRQQ